MKIVIDDSYELCECEFFYNILRLIYKLVKQNNDAIYW